MITDDKTGDSTMLKNVLGTVVRPECEEIEYEEIESKEIECKVDNMKDVHMELICGDTCVDEPLPRVNSPPPNMLAKGISPLSYLCGEPSSPGAYLLADGAYVSCENMKLCKELGIEPLIPIQTRCTTKGKGTGDAWGEKVRDQLGGSPETNIGNMDKEEREENRRLWKSKVGYNRRWLIEIIISAFKRLFGDHMHSRNWENMVQEIKLRVALYNM